MTKKTLNFNKPLLGLDGAAYTDEKNNPIMMNVWLSNALARVTNEPDVMKVMDWARALHKGEMLELDKSDLGKLRSIIRQMQGMWLILREQLNNILDGKDGEGVDSIQPG